MTPAVNIALLSGMIAGTFGATAAGPSLAHTRQPEPAPKSVTIVAFDHGGMGSMLVDKKDQKLKAALAMLPTRLRELPGEFPNMRDVPMPMVELLVTVLSNPGRLAVTFDPDGQERGAMGFGLVAGVTMKDRNAAQAMHGRIGGLMAGMGGMGDQDDVKPSASFKGMSELAAPFGGVIRYGPRESNNAWNYEVHVGALASPDEAFAGLRGSKVPAAEAFTATMSARLDFGAVSRAVETFMPLIEDAGPEAEMAIGEMEQLGILGEDAITVTMHHGFTADAAVGYTVIERLRPHAAKMGLSTTPLTDSHFSMIPSDATVAFISSFDLTSTVQTLRDQIKSDPEAAEGLEDFAGATGVDLFDDVLLSLGDVSGLYMSDSTGGSLASVVMFVSLRDRAKFEEAHSKLAGFANSMLASDEEIKGRIRVREWADGDLNLHSIIFPGLPVPLEVSYAVVGDWLVAGLTPQSVLAAARQISGKGTEGLRSNKGFAELLPAGNKVTSVSFIDTPRLMRDGYQYVSLMGSAVANMMRSSTNDAREPGLVVPTYAELRAGAKPMVSFTYWSGDDQVTESRADRSMLVNLSGIAGAASPFLPLIGAAFAAGAANAERQLDVIEDAMDQTIMVPAR